MIITVRPHCRPCCLLHADGQDGGATIEQGSCMFGHLDYHSGTGWDIAALSDKNPDYAVSVATLGFGYQHPVQPITDECMWQQG